MLCGVISKKNFAVNVISTVILILVMLKLCEDKGFCNIVIMDFVLFFSFIAIQATLYRNRTQINLFLQGKKDKKSKLILKLVNKIVEFKICGRDEVYFNVVTELQNNNTELTQQNSQLLVENNNLNRVNIENSAIIQHISNDKMSAISRIEQSINGVQTTVISVFRAFFSNINNYKEKELKEKIVNLVREIEELQRKYNNILKKLKKAEGDLKYIIQKGIIFEKALCRILHDFEGKDRVSKVFVSCLVQVLCRDELIAYSESLADDVYKFLPSRLVLKGSGGGKPTKPVIDATKELEKQLKN